ncbi:hypothetical protein CYMTET_10952 [Cymbomonas tetramitiformis]|uniref:Rotatin N-terminal domain-containing protein n=1 Tax=Cymbomonas tetramitiformis TaxID=36881 RepID=A0AAE0GN40_9CHLO|nr:hypothetical protein CYMTET_10952 [Cymbomonas tetramitiformis]
MDLASDVQTKQTTTRTIVTTTRTIVGEISSKSLDPRNVLLPLESKINAASGSILSLIDKLAHEVPEVRVRSLNSLIFKLDHGLVTVGSLAREDRLLRNLLNWFNFDECSPEELVFSLLLRVSRHHIAAAKLVSIGADQFLREMRKYSDTRLHDSIDAVLTALHSLRPEDYEVSQPELHPTAKTVVYEDQPASVVSVEKVSSSGEASRQYVSPQRVSGAYGSLGVPKVDAGASAFNFDRKPEDALSAEGSASDWELARAHIGAGNEQYLFEINVRLQFSDEPTVLSGALHELRDIVICDFPPEAILQRAGLLENVLSLLHTADDCHHLAPLTLEILLSFICRLRETLSHTRDPGYAMPAEKHEPQEAAAERRLNYPPVRGSAWHGPGATYVDGLDDEPSLVPVLPAVHLVTFRSFPCCQQYTWQPFACSRPAAHLAIHNPAHQCMATSRSFPCCQQYTW